MQNLLYANSLLLNSRKRRGGIRLEDDLPDGCEADPETLRLEEERRQKQKEQMEETLRQHEEKEKRRSDSLWQSFLSDVGSRPTNRSGASGRSSTGSLTSLSSVCRSLSFHFFYFLFIYLFIYFFFFSDIHSTLKKLILTN